MASFSYQHACCLALLVTCTASVDAHSGAPSPLEDLRSFSQDRPRACPDGNLAASMPASWRAEKAQCVWRGLLKMQRWHAPARALSGCTGPAAQYWAWMRTRFGQPMRAQSVAWDLRWPANAVRAGSAGQASIAVIVRNPDNSWTATEWQWTPSTRAATRLWQHGRWHILQQAAAAMQPAPTPALTPETVQVRTAWEDALHGRAAEIDGAQWRWQTAGVCMAIDTVGLSDAQVQMPFNASEGRLEQRAAMQLLLARRYPQADWLTPFSLLMQPAGKAGAKYQALWRDGDQVHGQLWIPRQDGASIIRVRMSTSLPAGLDAKTRAPYLFRSVRAVTGEIAALASAWDGRHER